MRFYLWVRVQVSARGFWHSWHVFRELNLYGIGEEIRSELRFFLVLFGIENEKDMVILLRMQVILGLLVWSCFIWYFVLACRKGVPMKTDE